MKRSSVPLAAGLAPIATHTPMETPPEQIAASHARHYAALLAKEEPGTPGWQFIFGQLSAAATLRNALRGREQ